MSYGNEGVIGPTITAQPQNENLCYGITSVFSITAIGATTYQWQVNTGSGFANIANGTSGTITYSGATTNSLSVSGATSSANGYQYRCVASCPSCTTSATSSAATLSLPFTVTPTFNGPLCSNRSFQYNANASIGGSLAYLWTFANGTTDNHKNNSVGNPPLSLGGSLILTVTDNTGCTVRFDTAVSLEAVYTVAVSNPGPFCVGGTIALSATSTSPIDYTWTHSATSYTSSTTSATSSSITRPATVTNAGTYNLYLATGTCSRDTAFSVVVQNPVVLSANTGTASVCIGGVTTFSNSTAGGTWSSSNTAIATVNSSTGVVTGVAAGSASITYSYPNGPCVSTTPTTVTVLSVPTATITYNGPFCATGSAAVTQTGQTGGTYSSTSGLSINTTTGAINLSASTAGAYTVTYTFSNGTCSNTATASITINALPTATISYSGPFCATGSATVNRTGTGGGTYSSTTGLSINAVTGTINLASSTPGTYTVTYTFNNGTCSNTTTASVTINALPTATIIYGSPLCASGTTTVIITGQTGGSFTSDGGLIINASTGAINLASSILGAHLITYSFTNGTCSNTTTTSITINALPTASISYGAGPFCKTGTATVNRTGQAGGSYSSDGGLSINSSTGAINLALSTPGSHTITYTFTDGTCPNTTTTSITINALPTASISYTAVPYCATGTATVTQTGQAGGSYSSDGGLSINSSTGAINLAISTAGSHTVTYTFSDGTCSNTTTTSITINALPTASISYNGGPYCPNGTATVTLTGQTGGTYTAPVALIINSSTGAIDLAASTPGTYTVTYTFNNGTCPNTTTTSITVNAIPPATISYGGSPYCATGTATVTQSGQTGGTYAAAVGLVIDATTGTIDLAASTAGTYTVSYSFATGTCVVPVTTSVTINALPTATISYAGNPYCANEPPVAVTRNGQAGGTYSALPAGLSIDVNSGTIDVGLSAPGTYTVYYSFTNGTCNNVASTSVTITSLVAPTISYGNGGLPFCATGSATITQTGQTGGTYTSVPAAGLSINAITGTIDLTASTAGTYHITYTLTGFSCSGTNTATTDITIRALPLLYTVQGGGSYCAGSGGLDVSLSGSDVGVNYELYLNNNPTGNIKAGTGSVISFGNQLTGGTYTVVAKDATSLCPRNMTGSITIVINPLPSVYTVQGGGSYCAGSGGLDVSLSGSDAGINYELYLNNNPTGNIKAGTGSAISFGNQLTGGTYNVVAKNATSLCPVNMTGSVTITLNALPVAVISYSGSPFCAVGTASVTHSGTQGGTYSSASGLAFNPVSGLINLTTSTPSTYTIIYSFNDGTCSNTTSATITINPLPSVYTVQGGGSYCSGGIGVSVTLSGSDNGINYELYFNNNPTGNIKPGTGNAISFGNQTQAGTYTVIATNTTSLCSRNMTASADIIINPLPPVYTVQGGGSYCAGSGGLDVSLSGSDVGINYELYLNNNPTGNIKSGTGSAISFGNQLTGGTYTVVATNTATSCPVNMTGSAPIVVNPLPPVYTVQGGGSYCAGSGGLDVSLSGSDAGIDYELYLNNIATGNIKAGTGSVISFGNQTQAGTYTVVAANTTSSCQRNMAGSVDVIVNPLPLVYTVQGGGSYCAGSGGLNVSLSASDAGINYELYLNNNPTGSIKAGTGTAISFGNQTQAGTYTVVAKNSTTACPITMTGGVTIVVNPLPPAYTIQGGGSYCAGGIGEVVSLSGSDNGINYELYLNNNPTGNIKAGTGSAISFGNQTQVGTYTVVATNITSACPNNMTGSVSVIINPLPPVYSVQGGGSYCAGGAGVAVTLAGSDNGNNYELYFNNNATGIIVAGTGSAISFGNQTQAGSYTVVAKNATSACPNNMTGNVSVIINPLPPVYSVQGGGSYCAGGAGVAVTLAGSDNGINYELYFNNNPTGIIVAGTGSTISFGNQTQAGSYTVIAKNTTSACPNNMTGSVSVIINPLPVAAISYFATPYCGTGVATVNRTGTPDGIYTSTPGLIINSANGTIDLAASTPGTYTVTYSFSNGTCSNVTTTDITIKSQPLPLIIGATVICEDGALDLTAQTINGAAYNWSSSNGFSSTSQNIHLINATPALNGNYTLTVSLNGCINSSSVAVSVKPKPVAVINGALTVCENSALSLTAADAGSFATYNWIRPDNVISSSNNLIINNISPSLAGTYQLNVMLNGCTNSASQNIIVTPIPVAKITGPQIVCEGSVLSLAAQDAGPGAIYNWIHSLAQFSGAQVTINNINQSQAGPYQLIVQKNGCTAKDTMIVSVTALPVAKISGDSVVCEKASVNLVAADAGPTAIYTWLLPDNTVINKPALFITQATPALAGQYNLTVANKNCVNKTSSVVRVKLLPVTRIISPDSLCTLDPLNVIVSSVDSAVAYTWSGPAGLTASGDNIFISSASPANSGAYIVTATKDGCSSVNQKSVVVKPLPLAQINGASVVCEGKPISLFAANAGASANYSWSGKQGIVSSNISMSISNSTLSDTGTYKLTVIQAGCVNRTSKYVDVSRSPKVIINPSLAVCQYTGQLQVTAQELTGLSGSGVFSGTVINNNGLVNTTAAGTFNILYTFTATNGCVISDTSSVKINPGVLVNAGPDKLQFGDEGTQLNASITGSYQNINWTNIQGVDSKSSAPFVKPMQTTTYNITIKNQYGCIASDDVVVKVVRIRIPNAFSPNADGIHDKWIVDGLPDFINCDVQIFNRYGQRLFISKGYQEPWDGSFNGNPMPSGTYYYIINLNDKARTPFSGWLQLFR
ncbi:MAG: C-terminal target protein [Chitinophagaceae bacterium]|nr:C-terminal target protein [Chitinophagaceae bacterium]